MKNASRGSYLLTVASKDIADAAIITNNIPVIVAQ